MKRAVPACSSLIYAIGRRPPEEPLSSLPVGTLAALLEAAEQSPWTEREWAQLNTDPHVADYRRGIEVLRRIFHLKSTG